MTLLNGERLPLVRRFNQGRLAAALNFPLAETGASPRVLWLYNPHEAHLADSVAHELLVYDVMDEYAAFPWFGPAVRASEARLLKRADWVFAGTQALFAAKAPQAEGRIELVLSGVDEAHFRPRAASSPPEDLAPLRARYRRLIGYAGMIDMRIDTGLIIDGARRHPEWGWVLLGPTLGSLGELRAAANVHLLGQKAYAELPAYYQAWDCALVPFVDSPLTRHVNPTKMLEYAAAGLPILARALPDVARFYAEGAFLYRTAEEFEAHLRQILDGPEEVPGRRVVADAVAASRRWLDGRSWDSIASAMIQRLGTLAAGRTMAVAAGRS